MQERGHLPSVMEDFMKKILTEVESPSTEKQAQHSGQRDDRPEGMEEVWGPVNNLTFSDSECDTHMRLEGKHDGLFLVL